MKKFLLFYGAIILSNLSSVWASGGPTGSSSENQELTTTIAQISRPSSSAHTSSSARSDGRQRTSLLPQNDPLASEFFAGWRESAYPRITPQVIDHLRGLADNETQLYWLSQYWQASGKENLALNPFALQLAQRIPHPIFQWQAYERLWSEASDLTVKQQVRLYFSEIAHNMAHPRQMEALLKFLQWDTVENLPENQTTFLPLMLAIAQNPVHSNSHEALEYLRNFYQWTSVIPVFPEEIAATLWAGAQDPANPNFFKMLLSLWRNGDRQLPYHTEVQQRLFQLACDPQSPHHLNAATTYWQAFGLTTLAGEEIGHILLNYLKAQFVDNRLEENETIAVLAKILQRGEPKIQAQLRSFVRHLLTRSSPHTIDSPWMDTIREHLQKSSIPEDQQLLREFPALSFDTEGDNSEILGNPAFERRRI